MTEIQAGADELSIQNPTFVLSIHDDDKKLVLGIKQTGAVEIGDGFTADEAARRFWAWMETIRFNGKKAMDD